MKVSLNPSNNKSEESRISENWLIWGLQSIELEEKNRRDGSAAPGVSQADSYDQCPVKLNISSAPPSGDRAL